MDWMRDIWMPNTPVLIGTSCSPNSLAVVHVVPKPIVLGPGESISDLTPQQQIERGIDWEQTARHSFVLNNLNTEETA
jgi:hypothetical protein